MAISTFYPENLETLHPLFFPEKSLYNCATPLFYFLSPSGKIMPQKQMLITILGRKKEKKKKRHP
jgi:hypothetical protein